MAKLLFIVLALVVACAVAKAPFRRPKHVLKPALHPLYNKYGVKYPRSIAATLRVNNGGQWGNFGSSYFCPPGAFASGFELKVEAYQGIWIDDTALNGIKLHCKYADTGKPAGTVSANEGAWGNWGSNKNCINSDGKHFFLTGFRFRVEPPQGVSDDTAANNIIFTCRAKDGTATYEVEGTGLDFGHYGGSSPQCPPGTAICGLTTKVEVPQGVFGDDTALNDVNFFCC